MMNNELVNYTKSLINKKGKVYLAGGWFSDEQMERLEYVKHTLEESGFDIFSPKDENLVTSNDPDISRTQAYQGNLKAIDDASFVLCITNCKDMGTIHESGYASAKNIPIVYFAENLNGPFNLMLAESGIHVVTSRKQLVNDLNDINVLEGILTNKVVNKFNKEIE